MSDWRVDNHMDYRKIAERRTPRLSQMLKQGDRVLDVGCADGSITRGIAEAVGESGRVVGIDKSERLVGEASEQHKPIHWLEFIKSNAYWQPYRGEFDIVHSSRLMQWLAKPELGIRSMKRAALAGGKMLICDYNYEKIAWDPQPPESMLRFYSAFKKWRQDKGLDNAIADHLALHLSNEGMVNVQTTDLHEETNQSHHNFRETISLWAGVAATKGHYLVIEKYITESERKQAEIEYLDWVEHKAARQVLYMLGAEGEV